MTKLILKVGYIQIYIYKYIYKEELRRTATKYEPIGKTETRRKLQTANCKMQNNKLEIRQKLIFSSKITNENDTRNHLINCISYIYVLYIGTSRDARMFAPIFYVQHFLPPQTYYPPPTTHRQSPIPNP